MPQPERQAFRVTHPFHPLYGQTFELVATRQSWGTEQAYYHDDTGRLRTLPITWTSLIPEDPVVVFGTGRSPFRLADLLELSRLLEAIQSQCSSPERLDEPEAGTHGGVK